MDLHPLRYRSKRWLTAAKPESFEPSSLVEGSRIAGLSDTADAALGRTVDGLGAAAAVGVVTVVTDIAVAVIVTANSVPEFRIMETSAVILIRRLAGEEGVSFATPRLFLHAGMHH